jgi:uncharacterized protein YdaT
MGKNQHVVKHKDGWAVKGAGNEKATKVTPTQKEAIEIAEEIATNQRTEVIVHGRDGRIRSKDSFGGDHFPPRDNDPPDDTKPGKDLHVLPSDDGWKVRFEGSSRASSVHDTQQEAIAVAREMARNQGSVLVIHGRNGRIRERDYYSPLSKKSPREVLFPTTQILTSKKAIKKAVDEVIRESSTSSKGK